MNYPINPRAGIANVAYTAGLISSWTEGGYAFTVNRNDQGCPLSISGVGGDHRINTQFDFDASGVFVGMKGDIVPSNMLQQLVVEAVGGRVVQSSVNVNGGVGIIGPDGKQVAGTASPYAFTTRALAETDNGQTRVCASAQVATVDASMPVGFGVAFKGAISFTAGSGVTITDVRTTGSSNPWCALTQTGVDTYDVVGTKA